MTVVCQGWIKTKKASSGIAWLVILLSLDIIGALIYFQ